MQQVTNFAHKPITLDIPHDEPETRRMPSRAHLSQVEIKSGADGGPRGLVRVING